MQSVFQGGPHTGKNLFVVPYGVREAEDKWCHREEEDANQEALDGKLSIMKSLRRNSKALLFR